jgi:hypothetical protein
MEKWKNPAGIENQVIPRLIPAFQLERLLSHKLTFFAEMRF